MPSPFLFALILSYVVFLAGIGLTGSGPVEMVGFWYDGFWAFLTFSMQMVLILGAIFAREMGETAHENGVDVHYPVLCVAGYLGLSHLALGAVRVRTAPARAHAVPGGRPVRAPVLSRGPAERLRLLPLLRKLRPQGNCVR
jgi:short subunit fatty acids transporter